MLAVPKMTATITNADFAEAAGIHFSMASRLRNGERKPGLSTVINTAKAYTLTGDEVLDWLLAIDREASASGEWLCNHVFGRTAAAA